MTNCSLPGPESTPSNAGVAGIGVLLGFMVPAALSIFLALTLIVQESWIHSHKPAYGLIRRKLLLAFSDQQILFGIGIQAVGLYKIQELVPYHFFLIWMLSLLSTAVHNSTLLVLVANFHSDRVLRWLRQIMMLANLVLSCVFGVFMLQVVQKGLETSTLATSCAWVVADTEPSNNLSLSFIGTIVIIAGNLVVFTGATWYLHDRRQRYFKWVQTVGILALLGIFAGAVARIVASSQAFGTPTTKLSDQGERSWTFATIVTLLMLLLPLITALEIYRGKAHQQQLSTDFADDKH